MSEEIELGPRLAAIAVRVLPDRPMADLCCDHALLAASVLHSGRVPRAIAGDINLAPLEAAASLLAELGVVGVELRRGDGFAVLRPDDEVATVVLAGVGAPSCERLLNAGTKHLAQVERLIVQPNHSFPKLGSLRARIAELGFGFVDECITHERGRFYVTMVVERGGLGLRERGDRELGPVLRRGEDPLWPAWLAHERDRLAHAVEGMQRARSNRELLPDYQEYLDILERAQAQLGLE